MIKKAFVGILLSLMLLSIFTFASTGSAHAQAIKPTNKKPVHVLRVTYHGKTYTSSGTEIVVPTPNGTGSIHFSVTSKNVTESLKVPLTSSTNCYDAVAHADYYDRVGLLTMHYDLDQYYCYNINLDVLTYFDTPQGSGGGIPGVYLENHNESSNWTDQPYQAEGRGNYTFGIGIPTPWGTVGSTCAGWTKIIIGGDGGWQSEQGSC